MATLAFLGAGLGDDLSIYQLPKLYGLTSVAKRQICFGDEHRYYGGDGLVLKN